jgi:recombination protein RecT
MTTAATELAVYTSPSPALKQARRFLSAQHEAIARRLAPFGMGADRYTALVLTELQKSDQLLEAMATEKGQISLQQAVYSMAQLGLEPGPLGHAYLLPFYRTRERFLQVVFVLGWRGMVQLALRSPNVRAVDAQPVYPDDFFEWRLGTRPMIDHRPKYDGGPDYGRLTHVYVVCHTRSGGHPFVVLTKKQIEYWRHRSKQPNGEAWQNNPVSMSLKVGVRRGFPLWPIRIQEQQAVDEDERREEGLDEEAEDGVALPPAEDGGRPPVRAGRDRRGRAVASRPGQVRCPAAARPAAGAAPGAGPGRGGAASAKRPGRASRRSPGPARDAPQPRLPGEGAAARPRPLAHRQGRPGRPDVGGGRAGARGRRGDRARREAAGQAQRHDRPPRTDRRVARPAGHVRGQGVSTVRREEAEALLRPGVMVHRDRPPWRAKLPLGATRIVRGGCERVVLTTGVMDPRRPTKRRPAGGEAWEARGQAGLMIVTVTERDQLHMPWACARSVTRGLN